MPHNRVCRFTKRRACPKMDTSRFTKCCVCHDICTFTFTKSSAAPARGCACHYTSQRSTCKALRLQRNLRIEVKPLWSPCHKKSIFDHQSTRFPFRLPRKGITKHTATRAQPRKPPARAQFLRACVVEMHFDDFQVKECSVNSSEIAVRGCEHFDQTPFLNHCRTHNRPV